MRESEKAALDVLAKSSDVHNCWAILDEAVTSGEDDQFTKEYIEGEREMLEGSIKGTIRALGALGGLYGIVVSTRKDNGSYSYMRKVREEHLTELERAAEFDRGYRAGQRAMDAERQAIALKLRKLRERGHVWNTELAVALGLDIHANNDCICDRIIHLLGGDTCNCDQGGDHGDCAERRRTGAADGDIDVDEHSEIRAVSDEIADALQHSEIRAISNEIADLLFKMDAESDADGTCPNDVPTPSITDELRECVETATKTYDDTAWHDVDDEDEHTWCSITVAEIDGIADRIEEQFSRVCEQQEAVLLKQMDQQRAMLTEQRDAARAKVIALCNECDKLKRAADRDADHIESLSGAYNDMECERDELQAKLDKANGENKGLRLSVDEQKESIAQCKKTIKKLTRDNEKVWKNVHELQAKLDEIAGVLGG